MELTREQIAIKERIRKLEKTLTECGCELHSIIQMCQHVPMLEGLKEHDCIYCAICGKNLGEFCPKYSPDQRCHCPQDHNGDPAPEGFLTLSDGRVVPIPEEAKNWSSRACVFCGEYVYFDPDDRD